MWPDEVAQRTKAQGPAIVVLAVPQEELDDVDPAWVADTVLVDATNRRHDELPPSWLQAGIDEQLPTSMVIAGRFGAGSGAGGGSGVRLVKALNHIAHHDVESSATPDLPLEQRRAAAVAAEDDDARGRVMGLLVRMGLDPVSVGPCPRAGSWSPTAHCSTGRCAGRIFCGTSVSGRARRRRAVVPRCASVPRCAPSRSSTSLSCPAAHRV